VEFVDDVLLLLGQKPLICLVNRALQPH